MSLISEYKDVPVKIRLEPTFHPEIYVKVKLQKKLADEKETIKKQTISTLEINLGVYLGNESNVAFLTKIDKKLVELDCPSDQFTDQISVIGVDLPPNILSSILRKINSLEETIHFLILRSFLECARDYFWKLHSESYIKGMNENERVDFISTYQDYDTTEKTIKTMSKPSFWAHFISYVMDSQTDSSYSYLEVLRGGNGSIYQELCQDVHMPITKVKAAEAIIHSNHNSDIDKLKKVFQVIYDESVDEVLKIIIELKA